MIGIVNSQNCNAVKTTTIHTIYSRHYSTLAKSLDIQLLWYYNSEREWLINIGFNDSVKKSNN